jgi:hypothetical protein
VFLVPTRRHGRLLLGAPATVGATVGQIKAGCDWGTARSNQLLIVVPDGVAKVTVGRRVTAIVHNNVAAFESDQNLDEPQRQVWYGPARNVIKRITRRCTPRC